MAKIAHVEIRKHGKHDADAMHNVTVTFEGGATERGSHGNPIIVRHILQAIEDGAPIGYAPSA